jgi:acyl carrier protein
MNNTVSFDQFRHMVADHFGLPIDRLTKDISFLDDLGLDSLSLVNFIIKLEKTYNIKIEMDNVWSLKNIGEAYDILIKKINPVQPPESEEPGRSAPLVEGDSI